MSGPYCPKCRSVLYPADGPYMKRAGVCSYCVTYDKTPDKRFREAYAAAIRRETESKSR